MPGGRHSQDDDAAALRRRLRDVYWIGGGSGAGKSTVARRIASLHGLRLYLTDDVMSDHASRSEPEDAPFLSEFMAMDMDERWVSRSPQTMLETFHWFLRVRISPGCPSPRCRRRYHSRVDLESFPLGRGQVACR